MQEFKKVTRESGYKRRPLIKEFKRGLNRVIKRKLAEAEEPPTTIGEWQERVVRLDKNQRQSRAEERMLGKNAAHLGRNIQPREGYRGGLYRGKGGANNMESRRTKHRGRIQRKRRRRRKHIQ